MLRLAAFVLVTLAACGPQEPPPQPSTPPSLMIADNICAQIIGSAPPEAQEAGWTIVTHDDLAEDDRSDWSTYHSVECPGLAEDDEWVGYDRTVYAVTSIQRQGDTLMQKLVLLRPAPNGYAAQTIWGPQEVDAPHVVFISSVPNRRETPPLQDPAFILSRGDTFAVAFHERDGQLRTYPIRD